MATTEKLKVLEFFSGIGGFHYALEQLFLRRKSGGENKTQESQETERFDYTVLESFDINEIANKVYKFNFNQETLNRGIEKLKPEFTDKYQADLFIMSPPCQPYTAGGNRLDHKDKRAAGLLHIIQNILPNIKNPPKFIFLENVPNFEISESRSMLIDVLNSLHYHIDEFLLSPVTIGIPNDRKRYYLAAYRSNENASVEPYPKQLLDRIHRHPSTYCSFLTKADVPMKLLKSYIDKDLEIFDESDYWVKEKDIRKRTNFIFDCVTPDSLKTSTFTKAYGTHHFFGSGSFLQTRLLDLPYGADEAGGVCQDHLINSRPRFFTPREVARLHGFPVDVDFFAKETEKNDEHDYGFAFPHDVTNKQRWNLLGNSLNVSIVSTLLEELLIHRPRTY